MSAKTKRCRANTPIPTAKKARLESPPPNAGWDNIPTVEETLDAWKRVDAMDELEAVEKVGSEPREDGEEEEDPWAPAWLDECTLATRYVRCAMRARGVEYALPFEAHKGHMINGYHLYKKLCKHV